MLPQKLQWQTDPELIELIDFLIERTKDSISPLPLTQLAEEFKEKNGSSRGISCLVGRICKFRSEIHQLDSIDTERKVRILFGLSASIDEVFLEKLRVDAHVEVDRKSRITKYRSKDGSFELEGDHSQSAKIKRIMTSSNPCYDPEYSELINFLIERTKDSKSPLNVSHLIEEFKEKTGSSQEVSCLGGRIYKFRSEIHQLDSIDTETKVRILFGLSASIDEDFLEKLRMDAHVEVDWKSRITNYKANDASFELEGDHSQSAKIKRGMTSSNRYDDPEYSELINFLIERTKDAKAPLKITRLAEEFIEKSGSSQEVVCLCGRIKKFRSEIHQLDSIDTAAKVKLLYAMSASIDQHFLEKLRVDAHVEVDRISRITKYRANDGSIELEGDHSSYTKQTPRDPNYDPECEELMNFLIERTKNSKSPLLLPQLAEEFKEKSGSSKRISCLYHRIAKVCSKIHGLDSIDKKRKVKMLLTLSAPINEDFLNELRKTAHVEVDEKNRITEYRAKDGSLQLRGDHSRTAKRKRRSRASKIQNDYNNGSRNYMTKTPGSVKRGATDMPNSFKKAKDFSPVRYASRMKFLKTIHSLVLNLDMPSLSPIRTRIEKNLRESSSDAKISNEEMIMAIEVLVTKIANRSVLNLSENVDSVSLKEFLCYLKAAILNSELEGLEGLLEEIKERIKEPASKDKNIPVETVASALQYALDGFSF